jgi:beta-lactamase regulating signal transducer with metallopeptidase domain
MPAIDIWLRQPAAQAVGWALLQFVWQGTALAALTALALLALRRSAADVRYVVSSIALALMLTLSIVTGAQKYQALVMLDRASDAGPAIASIANAPAAALAVPHAPDGRRLQVASSQGPAVAAWLERVRGWRADALLPTMTLAWLGGVLLLSLRLLTGWLWVQRLRTHGVAAADTTWCAMAARLARQLHISRAVAVLESSLVDVPTVIGFMTPVVLLPVSALAGLAPQQVEAILAHELAHIRRHDYLVNLLQTLVETMLFYHPAVWWLSRRIRIERENCCDDLAVSLCGDPISYAHALADLEALRSSGPAAQRRVAMAATGGSLLHRVRRLLGAPASHTGRGPAWLAGAVALMLVGGIAVGADTRSWAENESREQTVTAPSANIHRFAGAITPALKGTVASLKGTMASFKAEQRVLRSRPLTNAAAPVAVAADATIHAALSMSVAVGQSISHNASDSHGTWAWSNNGERLEVTYSGEFEFTDDDTDVRQMSAGGSLKISDGRWLGRHSVEIMERGGALEHRYFVNGSQRPYEPEGRVWLRDNLPKFVRNTGVGAEARVARFLKNGGPSAVMSEISRIDSTYVKGIYYKQLFAQATLTPEQYRQTMTQASRELRSSSYELAQMLIAVADHLPNDEASRAAYFQAAGAIDSDYELRRVYSTMLKRGPVSPSILAGILANVRSIDSDYELSELLRQIVAQQPLDDRNRAAFFAAVSTIDSAYERHRVLNAVVSGDRASDPGLLEAALVSAAGLKSSYETSTFLQAVLRQNGVEGRVRAPFFSAANTIDSAYERGRVLEAVVKRTDASEETLRSVLQSSRALGGYELSQLLQALARTHTLSGGLRDAYVEAATRLGDYEQGQALTALVRSERRK